MERSVVLIRFCDVITIIFSLFLKEVQPVMEELKSRHANTRLLGCFTNRCCEWADQLRHHFGDEFDVKANVEFALETFTKHIDASNESQHKCFREFKRIFRSQVDNQNGCETMVTADAVILADRYSDFLSSWRNVKCHSGKSVLWDEVFKEIVVMEDHVKRGCYTNIPQYCIRDSTTHGFVEIHQSLRRWISHSRTGIPIAMALISLGFHEFNKKRGIQSVDVGLVLKENNGPYVNLSSVSEHKMTKLNYVIGILEKGLTLGAQGSNEHGIIVEPGSHISRFLMYLKSYKSIVQFVPDILSAPRLVPYFLSPFHLISVPYFLKTSEINTEYFNDVEALRCCINRLKFEHASDISEDSSNLLFCVVSFLKNVYENTPKTNFSETASYPSENTSETASYLHKNALETANYFEYLRKIHGLDFDSNSLDELMELSKCRAKERVPFDGLNTYEFVANLFHVVVLILTNLRRFPVLPVYPRSWHPQSPQVLLLLREDSHIPILLQLDVDASLTSGDGGDEDLPLDSKFKNFRCRCGRGKAEQNQKPKCVTIKDSRYPSRCLCFRAGESCSSICDCRACNNPCGTRVSRPRSIADEAESLKRRKRNMHEGQQSLKRILSRVLVKPINEPNSWMFTEYILFEYALSLIAEDLNTEEDNLLTWSNVPIIIDYITEKYHHLVNLLTGVHGMNHWLRKKGYEDMEKRYTERQDDVTTNFELLE